MYMYMYINHWQVIGTSRAPENYTQDCANQGNTYVNPGDRCKPGAACCPPA